MSDDSKCLMNVTNGKLDGNQNTLPFLVSVKFTKKKKKNKTLGTLDLLVILIHIYKIGL